MDTLYSPALSPAASDLTFEPDKLTVTPRPRKGSLDFSVEDASWEWVAAGDTGDEVEVAQDSELTSPNFKSTPLKLSSLGRILGHTVGEYAKKRIVEGRRVMDDKLRQVVE